MRMTNQDFLIHQIKRKALFEMNQAHAHPYYEIYYLKSGKRKIFINHTLYTVDRGSFIMIAKDSLHRTTFVTNEPHERVVLNFTDYFLESLYGELGKETVFKCFEQVHMVIPLGRRTYMEELLQNIQYEYTLQDDFSKLLMRNHLYELLILLMRCQALKEDNGEECDMINDKIQTVAKYICENYDTSISLAQMAQKAHMSPTYFSKIFKKVTGFGFKEYLNRIRLKEAANLLLETQDSITSIAIQCGFSDSNYFGDVFKRIKGISPNQYRKHKGAI